MKYWAMSSAIVALFTATSATGQTAPAIANVQQLRDAIAKAERARDAGAAALQKADAAIAVLKAALPVDPVAASNTPQSATLLEGADKRGGKGESIPALKAELPVRPPDMPSWDSKPIAAYMLRMGDAPKQKSRSASTERRL